MHTFAQAVPACAAVSFYALYACVHDKVPRDICLFMAYANNQAQIDVAFEGSSKNGCKVACIQNRAVSRALLRLHHQLAAAS